MHIRPLVATATAATVLVASAGIAAAAGTQKDVQDAPALAKRSVALPDGLLATEVIGAATLRLSGGDRYETAAEVSRSSWEPESTLVVHLATGDGYADALAMGPSTLDLGPLLLTHRDTLPQATIEELDRLRPCFVLVVGGEAAVSDAVAQHADSFASPSSCGF